MGFCLRHTSPTGRCKLGPCLYNPHQSGCKIQDARFKPHQPTIIHHTLRNCPDFYWAHGGLPFSMRLLLLLHGELFGDMSHSDRVQEATHQDQPSMTKLATKVQTGKQISLGAQDFHVSIREGRTMTHLEVVGCIAWAKMWAHSHFWLGLPLKRSKTSSVCCVQSGMECWLYVAMSGGLHEYHWISLAKPSSRIPTGLGAEAVLASILFREQARLRNGQLRHVASVVHWGRCGVGCISFDLIYASMCLFLRKIENAQLGILPEAHLTNWEV